MTDSQVLKGSSEEDESDLGWKVVPLGNGAEEEGLRSVHGLAISQRVHTSRVGNGELIW